MSVQHTSLAGGRWYTMTLAEQLSHIGSEVHRAHLAEGKYPERFLSASDRALELFDLTLSDTRWHGRLRELGRVRDMVGDAILGGQEYQAPLSSLEPYFDQFALATVRSRSNAMY